MITLCVLGQGQGLTEKGLWASLVAQLVKNLSAMQETWVRSLGLEDPLEKGTTGEWTIQSMGSQTAGHD